MIKVKVSATYFTNVTNGRQRTNVDFSKEIPECPDDFLYSVVKKRYLPLWINEARKKNKDKYPNFDGVESVRIYDYEINDKPDGLAGKDLCELDEKGIQDLATKFCLIAAPLPLKTDIKTAREKCATIYLEKVKGLDFSTDAKKEEWSFWKKTPIGYKLDFSEQKFIIEDKQVTLEDDNKVVVKKGLEDILNAPLTEEELLEA